jgi:hypothetical protein
MDSRFFCSYTYPKESFFSIRKVGIRETEDSDNDLSRILALSHCCPTSSIIGHLVSGVPTP